MTTRLSDYSYQIDESGSLCSLGLAAANYLGYNATAELLGAPMDVLFAEKGVAENFLELLKTREQIEGLRVSLRHREGRSVEAILTAKTHGDDNQQVDTRYKGNVVPIPPASRTLQKPLEMDAIGTLAGGVAHDFNNILGAVQGFCELALLRLEESEEAAAEAAASDIRSAIEGINRGAALVEQMLALSRRRRSKKTSVDVAALIDELAHKLEEELPTNVEFELDITAHERTVEAEREKLAEAIGNLCDNARLAMSGTGGTLRLELHNTPLDLDGRGWLQLIVSDTGRGMESSVRDRVFEPFFTTRDFGQGTGLGLSQVHGLVNGYGGSIHCESQAGEGSRFIALLPLQEESLGEPRTGLGLPTGTERILLVEDSDILLQAFSSQLRQLGYAVDTAIDGAEALAKFRFAEEPFDLVITDLKMPYLSGLELVPALRSTRQDVPIILMTGFDELLQEDEVIRDQIVDDLLLKPIDLRTLSIAIRRVLRPTTS